MKPSIDIDTSSGQPPTRAEICNLPPDERLPWLELVHVEYPRLKELNRKVEKCHARIARCRKAGIRPADPPCLLVVGRYGTGKTTFSLRYQGLHPGEVTHPGPQQPRASTRQPVLRALIPSQPTKKTLAGALLHALGDPLADQNSEGVMTKRLYALVYDAAVDVIFLDDVQHFVDQDSSYLLTNASNWLKNFIKETGVACVLMGLQGEAELVVDSNKQLASLFGDAHVLEPFKWEGLPASSVNHQGPQLPTAKEGTQFEFQAFLSTVEAQLPLSEGSYLSQPETALRLFVACEGLLRPLMRLLRNATELALESGCERLDMDLLARTYDEWLAPERREIRNPFRGELPVPRQLPAIEMRKIRGTGRRRDTNPEESLSRALS